MDNNNNNDFESLIAADVSLGGGVWAVLLCVLATVACGGWIVSLLMREGAAATTTTATSSTTTTTTTATAEGEERDADEGAVAPPHVHGMLAMVCVCSVFTCMAQLSLVPDLPTAYSFSGVSRHPHDSYYSYYFRQRQQSQQRASPAAFRQTQQQHFAAASKNNDVSAPSYLLVGVRKLTVTPAFEPREKGRNNKNKNKNNGHNDQNNDNNNDSSGLARHRRGARGLLLFHHHNNTGARSTLQARRPQDERLS